MNGERRRPPIAEGRGGFDPGACLLGMAAAIESVGKAPLPTRDDLLGFPDRPYQRLQQALEAAGEQQVSLWCDVHRPGALSQVQGRINELVMGLVRIEHEVKYGEVTKPGGYEDWDDGFYLEVFPLGDRYKQLREDAWCLAEDLRFLAGEIAAARRASRQKKKRTGGPPRVSCAEAEERVDLLRKWAKVQEQNRGKRKRDRVTKNAFLGGKHRMVQNMKAYQIWYHTHVEKGEFPPDPRKLKGTTLRKLFIS